jgi:hypothetical protein
MEGPPARRAAAMVRIGYTIRDLPGLPMVRDTAWNGFLELNRLAFSEALPRNSESRALAVAMRMIKRHYPHIERMTSFADGCQCGDGTINRAAGFVLTGIKVNKGLLRMPDCRVTHKMTQVTGRGRFDHFARNGGSWSGEGEPLSGYQMRYIYFLNPAARARLRHARRSPTRRLSGAAQACIGELRVGSRRWSRPPRHSGGAAPTPTLQIEGAKSLGGCRPSVRSAFGATQT